MAIFDQRGQHVNYQYNVAGNINFDAVQNGMDLANELEKLKAELPKAVVAQAIDAEIATDAEYHITKAVQHVRKPQPNKKTVLDHINEAKALIEGVTAASGMIAALTQAAELVRRFF